MSEEVLPRVKAVFHAVFGAGVPFESSLSRIDEAQWTSLKHVEFIIALEGEFGVRFDGADATDMTNIPTVVERVGERLR